MRFITHFFKIFRTWHLLIPILPWLVEVLKAIPTHIVAIQDEVGALETTGKKDYSTPITLNPSKENVDIPTSPFNVGTKRPSLAHLLIRIWEILFVVGRRWIPSPSRLRLA